MALPIPTTDRPFRIQVEPESIPFFEGIIRENFDVDYRYDTGTQGAVVLGLSRKKEEQSTFSLMGGSRLHNKEYYHD